MNIARNASIVLLLCWTILGCKKSSPEDNIKVLHVERTSGVLNSDICSKFNANEFRFKGTNVYVAPYSNGYIIIFNKIDDPSGIFNFVSNKIN